MSKTLFGVLVALIATTGCGRSPELCYEDGVLDCESELEPIPDGSKECQAQYLLGYSDLCSTTTTTSSSASSSTSL